MVWSPHDEQWTKNYQHAKEFREKYGHLNLPVTYRDETGFMLGKWPKTQRTNREKLTGQQIQRLNDIGMEW